MNKLFELCIERVNEIGIFLSIKCIVVTLGIVLIYARVIKNFKDAKKQKNNMIL